MGLRRELFGEFGLVRTLARGSRHDYGRCYENGTDRWRLWLGDLAQWSEREGGCREGAKFTFEIGFGDHIGDFDEESYELVYDTEAGKMRMVDRVEKPKDFLTRWVTLQIWRWGIMFNWRGPEIDDEWDIPRWQFDKKTGERLEEWR